MPLEGQVVILREQRREDIPLALGLRNDLDTQAWSQILPPAYTEPMLRKQFEAGEFSREPTMARFIIEAKASGEAAGMVVYSALKPRFEATYGITVARAFWGQGVALDAQETLLRFLFVDLGLRVVRLWTHSTNPRMMGLAEKSGFRVAFRQRQSVVYRGQLADTVNMDILREEFFALHPELVDTLPSI